MSRPAWTVQLTESAEASPWQWMDFLSILFLLAGAQIIRTLLPESLIWDVLCFHGPLLAGLIWRSWKWPAPFGKRLPIPSIAGQAFVRWISILPLLWMAALCWQWILKLVGYQPDLQAALQLFMETDSPLHLAGFLLFAIVIAPIAEEGLFRGILQPLLVRQFGPKAGIVLVALAFGAVHGDVGAFVSLAVFSVALSLAVARTGSLWVAIVMHSLFNGVNLLILTLLIRAEVL